ncbi:hypothetical protein M422DRAFT_268111 [Sphaerobolus stellatus SS14]|uniref:Unplaced genomic scaffold SPHSTscaffold_188, whole genome shotgun sequence n=1 Tax=Sphaerobolus stellatus (strain SS14) TaxID=990650 RepID=A0A0C9TKP3_SPHS4|nr:hypothetical protein M422DRAFT_268111 [Sphaerobolus stellatus SS14]
MAASRSLLPVIQERSVDRTPKNLLPRFDGARTEKTGVYARGSEHVAKLLIENGTDVNFGCDERMGDEDKGNVVIVVSACVYLLGVSFTSWLGGERGVSARAAVPCQGCCSARVPKRSWVVDEYQWMEYDVDDEGEECGETNAEGVEEDGALGLELGGSTPHATLNGTTKRVMASSPPAFGLAVSPPPPPLPHTLPKLSSSDVSTAANNADSSTHQRHPGILRAASGGPSSRNVVTVANANANGHVVRRTGSLRFREDDLWDGETMGKERKGRFGNANSSLDSVVGRNEGTVTPPSASTFVGIQAIQGHPPPSFPPSFPLHSLLFKRAEEKENTKGHSSTSPRVPVLPLPPLDPVSMDTAQEEDSYPSAAAVPPGSSSSSRSVLGINMRTVSSRAEASALVEKAAKDILELDIEKDE